MTDTSTTTGVTEYGSHTRADIGIRSEVSERQATAWRRFMWLSVESRDLVRRHAHSVAPLQIKRLLEPFVVALYAFEERPDPSVCEQIARVFDELDEGKTIAVAGTKQTISREIL